jgi:exopolysaccharide biosynthesis protein
MNGWNIHPPRRLAAACLFALIVLGCNLSRVTEQVTLPTPATPSPVSDWQIVAQGIERRDVIMRLNGGREARAALVRIDPAAVTFRVHYSPDDPHTINEWRDVLPDAAVIVNGSFFDGDRQALGLLASDGQHFGQSFMGFGGMFQVTDSGPRVRSLVGEPYQGESFIQAVQAFPMLIEAGGVLASQDEGFTQRNRRSVIAQDRDGRIIIAVVAQDRVSLADLQGWLITSDLNVYIALGLDGGKSTGLVVNAPGHSETIPNLDAVPAVIAVYGP